MEKTKLIILPVILNGDNYLLWSRITKTSLCSRGLWYHIEAEEVQTETASNVQQGSLDGSATGVPATTGGITSLDNLKWFQEDQMVLKSLQNSLEQSVLAAHSHSKTAKELWENLQSVFGYTSYLSRIFEIKKALICLQQGENLSPHQFGKIRALWTELGVLRPPTTDPTTRNQRSEEDQIIEHFLSLNYSLSDYISSLGYGNLPNLNDDYLQIQKDEDSIRLANSWDDDDPTTINQIQNEKDYVDVACQNNYSWDENDPMDETTFKVEDVCTFWCEHCKKDDHTKEDCWILHPHLQPSKTKQPINGMVVYSASESPNDKWVTNSGIMSHTKYFLSQNISGNVLNGNEHNIPIEEIGNLKMFYTYASFMLECASLFVQNYSNDYDYLAILCANNLCFQDIGEGLIKDNPYTLANIDYGSVLANKTILHDCLGYPHILMILLTIQCFDNEKGLACILREYLRSPTCDQPTLKKRSKLEQISWLFTTPDISFSNLIPWADIFSSLNEYCIQVQKKEGLNGVLGQTKQTPVFISKTCGKAMDSKVWNKAIHGKSGAMNQNCTWDELPKDMKHADSKWLYTIMDFSNGDIRKHLAQTMAKDFEQTYEEDYKDSLAQISNLYYVQIIIPFASNLSCDFLQNKNRNTYLQRKLDDNFYMLPPPRIKEPFDHGDDLKQQILYHKLCSKSLKTGFKVSQSDHSLTKIQGETGIAISITCANKIDIPRNKVGIGDTMFLPIYVFKMNDLGELNCVLGKDVCVCQFNYALFMSQSKFPFDLFSETVNNGDKPARTSIVKSYKNYPKGELIKNSGQYQRIVGKLINLIFKDTYLCFSVKQDSHMHNPLSYYWNIVELIQRNEHAVIIKRLGMLAVHLISLRETLEKDTLSKDPLEREERMERHFDKTFYGEDHFMIILYEDQKTTKNGVSQPNSYSYRQVRFVPLLSSLWHEWHKDSNVNCTLFPSDGFIPKEGFPQKFLMRQHHIRALGIQRHSLKRPKLVTTPINVWDIFMKSTEARHCTIILGKLDFVILHQPSLRGNVEREHLSQYVNDAHLKIIAVWTPITLLLDSSPFPKPIQDKISIGDLLKLLEILMHNMQINDGLTKMEPSHLCYVVFSKRNVGNNAVGV